MPPSPDETFAKANQSDYSSPGQHPAQDKKNLEPDMDNASQAVKQQARHLRLHVPGESTSVLLTRLMLPGGN